MFENILVIAGAPRSGTSWLGQIIDSSPDVAYRMQPLFSYAFKDAVNADSTVQEYVDFFRDIYASDDAFLLQTKQRQAGIYPIFEKGQQASMLTIKMVRYHYLLQRMLHDFANLKVLSIVRHPCGVINSWLRAPREFPEGVDPRKEWRFGGCRNQGRKEEFFGFYKWKEVAHLYLDLRDQYPDQVCIVQYEELVSRPVSMTLWLFEFAGLRVTEQTLAFLKTCHATHQEDPYAVFKDKAVAEQWKLQLDPDIVREIIQNLKGTRLARFLA